MHFVANDLGGACFPPEEKCLAGSAADAASDARLRQRLETVLRVAGLKRLSDMFHEVNLRKQMRT